jgi:hypothetical protein
MIFARPMRVSSFLVAPTLRRFVGLPAWKKRPSSNRREKRGRPKIEYSLLFYYHHHFNSDPPIQLIREAMKVNTSNVS